MAQGTVSNKDVTTVIGPTLEALADEDVIVAVSKGQRPPADLPPVPGNARAAGFLPDAELMPKTVVYVTNGGGIHNAMESGRPDSRCGRHVGCGAQSPERRTVPRRKQAHWFSYRGFMG